MKIKSVKAFKYDGILFESKKGIKKYVEDIEDQNRIKREYEDKKKLDDPAHFTITEGYFDFFVFPTDSTFGEDYKRVCYRTKTLAQAINKVLKRNDCTRLDYEVEILDKNKRATGIFIDLYKMPKGHPVHSKI